MLLKGLNKNKVTCFLNTETRLFISQTSCDVSPVFIQDQIGDGVIASRFLPLVNPHADWAVLSDIEFDVNLLIDVVVEGDFQLSDKGSQRIVLYDEKCLYLFLKLLLVEQEVARRRVLPSDLGDSVQQFFGNVFELKQSPEVKLSAWVPQVIIYFLVELKDFHQVVVLAARQTNFVLRL